MKYRRNKVKREHGIIEGALLWLEELGRQPEVTDIIPGVIEVSRSPERGVVYKYETRTGCKLLLKSNGSVQEAFVVTKNPLAVKKWVENNFPPGAKELRPQNTKSRGQRRGEARQSSRDFDDKYDLPVSDYNLTLGDLNSPNLGEILNPNMRRKLRALQQKLAPRGNKK